MYDLENDPGEKRGLYGDPKYADVTKHLLARLTELRREAHDPALKS